MEAIEVHSMPDGVLVVTDRLMGHSAMIFRGELKAIIKYLKENELV